MAKYEWHPFTISSAPEKQGVFWLHIRAVGTWTNRLYRLFEEKKMKERKSKEYKTMRPCGHYIVSGLVPL